MIKSSVSSDRWQTTNCPGTSSHAKSKCFMECLICDSQDQACAPGWQHSNRHRRAGKGTVLNGSGLGKSGAQATAGRPWRATVSRGRQRILVPSPCPALAQPAGARGTCSHATSERFDMTNASCRAEPPVSAHQPWQVDIPTSLLADTSIQGLLSSQLSRTHKAPVQADT